MSIILPPYLDPLLWFYGLDNFWLDVDEDAVVDWGDELISYLSLVDSFAKEVITVLGELEEVTETETFAGVREFIDNGHKQHFAPVFDDIKVYVPITTGVIHHTVVASKTTVIGIFTTNAAMDIPLIVSGQFWLLAAKKLATKNLLDMLLYEAKEIAVRELTEASLNYIEQHWLNEQKDAWKESLSGALANFVSTGTSSGGTSANPELAMATVDVTNCIVKLGLAVDKFQSRNESSTVGDAIDDKIRDQSATGSDGLVRVAIAEVLKWGVDQLKGFVIDLALAILDKLSEMLEHADETLTEAEQEIADDAQALLITLMELRPAGVAKANQGAPDFWAPVRDSMGVGNAEANAANPGSLDAPVGDQRGLGRARGNPQDVSVLDAPTGDTDGIGSASGADSGATPQADGSTTVLRGAGRSGSGDDQPDVDSTVEVTEGVDVPSSDTGEDVTELDAEVDPVN